MSKLTIKTATEDDFSSGDGNSHGLQTAVRRYPRKVRSVSRIRRTW